MNPIVSINLCCYNSEKYLEETLQSIFAQTYKDWELVIIDDGSTDSTAEIIQGHVRNGWPIVYHHQANAGLGNARNTAIRLSKGQFIAFLDHDDLWLPQKLEKQISLFAEPEVGLVYSDAIYFNEAGDNQRLYRSRQYYTGRCFSSLLVDYFLCLQTVMLRRSALEGLTYWFNPQFRMSEEADLFTRIGYGWKLAMVDEPLAKWRVHGSSETWKHGHLFSEEIIKMLELYHDIIPDFASKYKREIDVLRTRSAVNRAMFLWRDGNGLGARRALLPFVTRSVRAALVLLASFLPQRLIIRLLSPWRKTKILPIE